VDFIPSPALDIWDQSAKHVRNKHCSNSGKIPLEPENETH